MAECAELRGEPHPLAEKLTLAMPRSRCPHCGHGISAFENIPILSYLALRGRCSACRTRISPRYPIVEALSGLLSGYAIWRFGTSWAGMGALLFIWGMLTLSFIDFDTQLLPDSITLPLLWGGLLLNLDGTYADIKSAVVGAAAGYLSLWIVYWSFKLATGKEGMGHGDFKLLALFGAWLGWDKLPAVILLSSLAGALIGLGMILALGHDRRIPIPFGPYLAIAGWAALIWGDAINAAYLDYAGLGH